MAASPYRTIKRDGRTIGSHRVIWEEAHGPIPDGYVVHHVDHNKRNNALSNLQLMTHQEHSEHHNQKYPRTKLCEVCGVRYEPHPTKRARAKTCGPTCRSELIRRAQLANPQSRISPEQREAIRARVGAGERRTDLALEYGISKSSMTRIARDIEVKETA